MSRGKRFFLILFIQIIVVAGLFTLMLFDHSIIVKNHEGKLVLVQKQVKFNDIKDKVTTKTIEKDKDNKEKEYYLLDKKKVYEFFKSENKKVVFRRGVMLNDRRRLKLIVAGDKKATIYDFGDYDSEKDKLALANALSSYNDDEGTKFISNSWNIEAKMPLIGYIVIAGFLFLFLGFFIFYPKPLERKFKNYNKKKEKERRKKELKEIKEKKKNPDLSSEPYVEQPYIQY